MGDSKRWGVRKGKSQDKYIAQKNKKEKNYFLKIETLQLFLWVITYLISKFTCWDWLYISPKTFCAYGCFIYMRCMVNLCTCYMYVYIGGNMNHPHQNLHDCGLRLSFESIWEANHNQHTHAKWFKTENPIVQIL